MIRIHLGRLRYNDTMKKHFYHHLIEIEPLQITLDELVISDKEKNELITIVESTTHYVVTDIILTELNDLDKKKFLSYLAHNEHDKIWDLLTKKLLTLSLKFALR